MAKEQTKKETKRELGVLRYLRDTRGELRKVTWPTREEALKLTYIVLGVTLVFAAFLGFLDWVFSQVFRLLFS
jgi:preprotein translocase subunit SecE